ncbi:MAG: sigma-70 family RNA polymerase sigma factor [Actinobacteria bacterium]|nr:MAG: sigma-70 family RNA polymerase sigma factor [Actinomycetota bacterium]
MSALWKAELLSRRGLRTSPGRARWVRWASIGQSIEAPTRPRVSALGARSASAHSDPASTGDAAAGSAWAPPASTPRASVAAATNARFARRMAMRSIPASRTRRRTPRHGVPVTAPAPEGCYWKNPDRSVYSRDLWQVGTRRRCPGSPEGDTISGDGEGVAKKRAVIYCVVPSELADELHDELRRFYRDQPDIEVIVEQRRRDRRRKPERRVAAEGIADERRAIRASSGRRVADRRAAVVPAEIPALPARAEEYRAAIAFVERLEPSTVELEDVDTARLVVRLQAGEKDLFGQLYMRYFDRVYAYLKITLHDAHEAEDAAQDVFIRVLEALPRYERRASPFRGWLFRIVRNTGINRLRQRQRLTVEAPEELVRRADEESARPDSLDWLDDRTLVAMIEDLPLGQRQVIVLRYMMDLRSPEIAEILERSPEAVRQLHQRAMRFLRERLREPNGDNPGEAGAKLESAKETRAGASVSPGRRRIPREPSTRLRSQAPVMNARRLALRH